MSRILLRNTPQGLKPMYGSDYEEKKKIKTGATVWAEVKEARNYENHKRFFAMISCAWFNLTHEEEAKFRDENHFRYQLMVSAGHADMIIEPVADNVYRLAHSIKFSEMDETEFRQVFSDVLDVLMEEYVSTGRENFLNAILDFL